MKNLTKLFTLLLFVGFLASCTAENVENEQQSEKQDVYATGGNSSAEIDIDRD